MRRPHRTIYSCGSGTGRKQFQLNMEKAKHIPESGGATVKLDGWPADDDGGLR